MSRILRDLIIGGGQAGLSVGYHLAQQDRSFVILEANDRIGDNWRKRFDSLRLFSPARYDGLPGLAVSRWTAGRSRRRTRWPTTSRRTRSASSCPSSPASASTGVASDGDRYVVRAGAHRFEADNVVVASGTFQEPSRARVRLRA